ncbi:aldehyde dehydrogenase [Actinoplanes sp. NBRC 14428]|uniref:Acyl-CoA reductase-like NAD-dependent aldehyde dehydrogenase n=1 Tax=Pseudosporangium ferrugineum TaxID=439699 RepID=A0A2T0SBM0_9ACTN|nr:aldehyde dehydrogenase family protein [Pseudosporangium ferrugineum]PRY30825.1 acyl-CoA reductase-like NAD-dependent aldehyde dehydrogenase [Pseudosporangium ferrugineum]BCJ50384.1 aldehyde dehydrogenase [Actinoplanes sp. NBRC 14428]
MTTDVRSETPLRANLIAGALSEEGTAVDSVNPSTSEVIGQFVQADRAQVERAIAAARRAFDTTDWSTDPRTRFALLNRLADQLSLRAAEIGAMLSRENGKLERETMWEAATSVEWLRYSAGTALTAGHGTAEEVQPGVFFRSAPAATGVAGIISPWNSPIILTIRALGPALAAGCTVVVKLPGQTGLTNAILSDIVASAGFPEGVVNIFSESANVGAPLLVSSPQVDVVNYTGSTAVGRVIAREASATLKRVGLELGGKTPLVVFEDADLDLAVATIVAALTVMNGQFCVTGSRVLVHRSVAGRLREALVAAISSLNPGPSDDPASDLGPLIDAASAARVDALVTAAEAYGTMLVRGGRITDERRPGGAYYRPSLVEVERLDVPLVQEEIFGPVQTFEVFDDEDDAIRRANATPYGLGAAVFTRSSLRAQRVARRIESGMVWSNCWAVLSEKFEQGGLKQSGYGYLCGPGAIREFQSLRVFVESVPPPA